MNRLFSILVAVCVLCAFTVDAHSKIGIQVGGGMLFEDGGNYFGITIKKDIPLVGYVLEISPCIDIFRYSGEEFGHDVSSYIYNAGIDMVLNFGLGKTPNIYFGGGIGFGRWNAKASLSEFSVTDEDNGLSVAILSGVEFGLRESLALFVQGKWLYLWLNNDQLISGDYLGNFVLQAGVIF